MKLLVTGGNGFIGSHVVAHALELGHSPIVFDRTNTGQPSYFGDIRDATHVTEAVAHVDAVIHLAGVLGTQETIDNPLPAAHTNILGGLNVLEACRQYDLPLVYIAVGNHWMDNPYSISKTTVERFCRMYRAEHGLNVSIVRAMNAYGPGQVPCAPYGPSKVRKIVPAFVCRALVGEPVEVYGDGQQVMDMVHVSDVADTLIASLGMNGDYDCGTGQPTNVEDIANEVLHAVGSGSIKHLPMRPGEPERSVVIAEPHRLLKPAKVMLHDGIRWTVEWYRDNWLPQWRS